MRATALIVDGDRQLCQILQRALEGAGFQVLLAHDGETALSQVRSQPPSLVLMDSILPRRDGFEVLHEIRSLEPPGSHTPVVLLSGCRLTPAYQERATRLGAAQVLCKPVPLDRLIEVVRAHAKDGPPTVAERPFSSPARPVQASARVAAPRGPGAPAQPTLPELRGQLEELPFPNLLHHLHGLRATGVLMLGTGKKRKAIQLRDGYPVAVKSNLIQECLGNLLVRRGLAEQGAVVESLRRHKKGEGLQGEILVAMEVLTEEEIAEALREQAEEKLFEIFEWRRGEYRFQPGGRLKGGNELALSASPASLILRGVRKRMPLSRIDQYFKQHARDRVTRSASPFYRFQEIDLSIDDEAFLAELPDEIRLGDMRDASESHRRLIFALVAAEMLERRASDTVVSVTEKVTPPLRRAPPVPPAPRDAEQDRRQRAELAAELERLRNQSHYAILELREDASDEDVAAACEALSSRFHPDRFAGSSQAVRQLAEEVSALIGRLCDTLLDPRSRKEYAVELRRGERRAAEQAESRRALDAEMEFQKGEAALKTRDYEIALRYFGTALQMNPEEAEYHAHYGWTLHLLHPDDATMAQEAIEHLKRAIKLDRDREKPYLFLGRLFKAIGRNETAEKMFTRAIQIRPECVEALRELRLINLRRQKSKGLVRRLLRR